MQGGHVAIFFFLAYLSTVFHAGSRQSASRNKARSIKEIFAESQINLTVCWILENDSYYSTYERLVGAVDLSIQHANEYILPDNVRLNVIYQDAGPSCSDTQYSVTANVLQMLKNGASCDIFLGAGCPTTAVALYGIATNLDVPIFGCPAAGTASLALNPLYDRFRLLIRVSFGLNDIVMFLNNFLALNGYTHLAIMRDDFYTYFQLMAKLMLRVTQKLNPVLYSSTFEYPFMSDTQTLQTYSTLIQAADDVSRVFLILTHGQEVRKIMIAASLLGLTQNGEYMFIAVQLYELPYWGIIRYDIGDTYDTVARDAFRSLMIVSLMEAKSNSDMDAFDDKVKHIARAKYNYTFRPLEKLDPVILSHYESIMIYAQEVAGMVKGGFTEISGAVVVDRVAGPQGSEYKGVAGPARIGPDGERDIDLELRTFNFKAGEFEAFIEFIHLNFTDNDLRRVQNYTWPGPTGKLPLNEPQCGFRGEGCVDKGLSKGAIAAAIIIPLLTIVGLSSGGIVVFLKFRKMKKDYNPSWWRITSEELNIKQNRTNSAASKRTLASASTIGTSGAPSGYSSFMCDILASYNGSLVALTDVAEFKRMPTPEIVNRFNQVKACAACPNLQKFIGAGLSSSGICDYLVNEPCSKGSLTDILDNEMIKLDWSFKNSLIKDIVFGMTYLHTSPLTSHGNLTSEACLIDGRFTLKISDYGLPFFRKTTNLPAPKPSDIDRPYDQLLWRAPELLRMTMPVEGTQKGDVYSFAIILQQIILRSGPFELPNDPLELSDKEIIQEVVASTIPPVRPRVPRAACSNELYDLMERCWEEIPIERPTFLKIKERLKRVIGDVGDNFVDLLFKRMEQYAMDLEFKVAEKTQQFMDEKSRSEQLLSQLLPKLVAAALTRGENIDPEAYESVTIFFSDIVGFTTISASGTPMDVISLLNRLYTFFDGVLEKYDVYKVETIGDAYMVSSGLPARNGNRHAAEIAHMSLDLLKGISYFEVPNRPNIRIEIRAGINSGPCVAGIVGLKMPRYCLFGDTVNTASRMESTGEPMKIQITQETKNLLVAISGFVMVERGPVVVKGKGTLVTHWLLSSEKSI